jgi:hypothetical protein
MKELKFIGGRRVVLELQERRQVRIEPPIYLEDIFYSRMSMCDNSALKVGGE